MAKTPETLTRLWILAPPILQCPLACYASWGSSRWARRFLLADGQRMEMDYGQAWATIDGDSVITLVVFGEDDGPALLGAYTLEGLSLAVDPIEQRLVPTHLIMY